MSNKPTPAKGHIPFPGHRTVAEWDQPIPANVPSVTVGITRRKGESWREAAIRIATKYGLQHEVAEDYDEAVKMGSSGQEAAFHACWEWDICDIIGGE